MPVTTLVSKEATSRRWMATRGERRLDLGIRIQLDGSVPFRRTSDVLVPPKGGVYLIHDLRGALYVGRTCDLLRRFQEHEAQPSNPLIAQARSAAVGPIMFSWVVLGDYRRRRAVEAELVAALNPPCNRCFPTNNGN